MFILTPLVGPSLDPSGVSFVDCIKAYCKAKDVFGWTEKSAADATASTAARMPAPSSSSKSSAASAAASAATDDGSGGVDEMDELLSMPINTKVVTSTDRYVYNCPSVCVHVCVCVCACVHACMCVYVYVCEVITFCTHTGLPNYYTLCYCYCVIYRLLCNVVTVLSNIYLLAKQESSPVSPVNIMIFLI